MAQIKVRDEHGNPITSRISIRIFDQIPETPIEEPQGDGARYDVTTDMAGNTGWPIPKWSPPSATPLGHYILRVNNSNADRRFEAREVTKSHDNDATIVLKRRPLQRLHVGPNRRFYRADGSPIFVKGNTDLLMYKRFLDWKLRGGPSIEPLLLERSSLGSECISTFGMLLNYQVPAHLRADVTFRPEEYGDEYHTLAPDFAALLARYGMYWYGILFADAEDFGRSLQQEIDFFLRFEAEAKKCDNFIGNLNNEPYAHTNAVQDPYKFPRPFANPWCAGSFNDEYGAKLPPWPRWDFHDYHTPRNHNRVADCCVERNPNYEAGQLVVCAEGDKYGGPNQYNPKVYRQDPDECRRMRDTAEGSAGMFLAHTSAGNYSIPFNDVERECVRAACDH